jgi:uncharacterized protein YkvS
MENVFFALIACNIAIFLVSLIAIARVGEVIKSTKGLDWDSVARLTGDVATIKKNIQSQNNRLNGMMDKPLKQEELIRAMMEQNNVTQINQSGG